MMIFIVLFRITVFVLATGGDGACDDVQPVRNTTAITRQQYKKYFICQKLFEKLIESMYP
jgi:hypothetical protein